MAATYKVLGQVAPAATTNTDLDTIPASTQAVVSTITVCNQSATAATFRIAVRPAGAALAALHYVVYDAPLAGNETKAFTLGITMGAADVITVYASTASLSFASFGVEIV